MQPRKSAIKPNAPLRALPRQRRGEVRVNRILDAAEEILIETGIQSLTPTAVASRSGSAVGSMYRFFLNREQIVDAVVTRLRTSLEEDWSRQMRARPETVDPAIFAAWYTECFRRLGKQHPVFAAVVRHLSEHCPPLEKLALQPLEKFLAANAPQLKPAARAIACRLVLAMATDALQMSRDTTIPQKQIWDTLRDALSLLLQGYVSHRPKALQPGASSGSKVPRVN